MYTSILFNNDKFTNLYFRVLTICFVLYVDENYIQSILFYVYNVHGTLHFELIINIGCISLVVDVQSRIEGGDNYFIAKSVLYFRANKLLPITFLLYDVLWGSLLF